MPDKKLFRVSLPRIGALFVARGSSDMNYHGPRDPDTKVGATKRSAWSKVRLTVQRPTVGWRLIRYRADGSWLYLDVVIDRRPRLASTHKGRSHC